MIVVVYSVFWVRGSVRSLYLKNKKYVRLDVLHANLPCAAVHWRERHLMSLCPLVTRAPARGSSFCSQNTVCLAGHMYECSVIIYLRTVESTLPWRLCQQGAKVLDKYEHFACYTGQTHMDFLRSASKARVWVRDFWVVIVFVRH